LSQKAQILILKTTAAQTMSWYRIHNFPRLPSPSLLLYEERALANIQQMVSIAGQASRLRPHLKTHKLPQLLHRLLDAGVRKAKAATIAEAEMAALSGVPDVLLAQQPGGANAWRWVELVQRFPQLELACLVDSAEGAQGLQEAAEESGQTLRVLLDVNVGQNRTGIAPEAAAEFYQRLSAYPNLRPQGLHLYDGHLSQADAETRYAAADGVLEVLHALVASIPAAEKLVLGGSPTFPHYAQHAVLPGVELSPGTTVLWDQTYADLFPEMPFQPAAVLLTRVVSKPGADLLCLDLGHKAVASEMPHPRVVFPDLPDAVALLHNDEHLVIRTSEASEWSVGDALYAFPRHICPTVALHSEVFVVRNQEAVEPWPVVGRTRRISI
jgi:D-threonine aldolase